MTWYTLFPDADKKQVNGSAITATSTKYKGGTIFALGTALPANTVITAFVQLGNRAAVHGSQVVQSKDVFGAIHTAPVAITSVADDGSGFCDYTLATHGLVVGQVVNITGSTSGNLDGPQKITSLPDVNSFVTDRAYVASATAGNYTLVSGRFASMTAGEYLIRGYTLGGGSSPVSVSLATYGSDFGIRRSIHKLEHMRTRRVATAIRAGNWNIYTGQFTTAPVVADDAPTWGTDEAATPTRAIPGELVYRHSGMPDGTYGPVQKDYPAKTNG
jgi:hypothetical protein